MIHFQRRFNAVTDIKLGDCSYLGSCYNKDTCPYVHYDMIPAKKPLTMAEKALMGNIPEASRELLKTVGEGDELRGMKRCKAGSPLQWINIDVTVLPMDVLGGDYGAIMMDPPWPIHMRLPYRQMSDEDILNLEIEKLSKNGVIFLWVTSRVYSIGVKCLEKWGYKHTDSILWVKTNQLGGTIATGRTGHWLNHMQETCLVGIKGKPTLLAGNAGNVLVEKVRETSRKPEGIYEIIEALVGPYCPKVEIFGRQHNIRHGWLTIGNQLPSTYVHDIGIYNRLLEF
ncbi:MT-A70-domain-containing protein, partial [Pyronema omphalodes]